MGLEVGGGGTEEEEEEKEEKIPLCESLGHRPLWGCGGCRPIKETENRKRKISLN